MESDDLPPGATRGSLKFGWLGGTPPNIMGWKTFGHRMAMHPITVTMIRAVFLGVMPSSTSGALGLDVAVAGILAW